MENILSDRVFLPIGKGKDLTGQKFGRLTAIGVVEKGGKNGSGWLCSCECGGSIVIGASRLLAGYNSSCGCGRSRISYTNVKNRRLLQMWRGMVGRCHRSVHKNYVEISVCEEWRKNYFAFEEWALNNGYEDYLTIDRINVYGDYTPGNCRFATWDVQARNKSSNHFLTAWEEKKVIQDWVADSRCKVCQKTLVKRLRSGWGAEDAIGTPDNRYTTMSAFGESKTLTAWAKDDRCLVSRDSLRKRINAGMALETAILLPPRSKA